MIKLTTRCLCFIALMLAPIIFQAQTNHHASNNKKKELNMSTIERNKQVIRDLYELLFNNRNLELSKTIIDPEYSGTNGKKGPTAFDEGLMPLFKGFPDIHWTLGPLTAEGNTVISRWTWTATQTGHFQFLEPTGKKVTVEGLTIYTLENGKIIKSENLPDRLGFLQSMELVPTDLSTLTVKGAANSLYSIGKFTMPADSKSEFFEKLNESHDLLKKVPGFIKQTMYEHPDGAGNFSCLIITQWKDQGAMKNANETIQGAYKKEGFDRTAFYKKLQIVSEQNVYQKSQLAQ